VAFRRVLSYNSQMTLRRAIVPPARASRGRRVRCLIGRAGWLTAVLLLAACATANFDQATTTAALRADANGDRDVSCVEWRSWIGATFVANDANKDGVLSEPEYERFVVDTELFQAIPLTRIDTDADGQYSHDEIAAAGAEVFEKGDRNNDCVLSRRELKVPKARAESENTQQPSPGPNVPDGGGVCKPPFCVDPERSEIFPSKKES
jgi:hypothetical protein